MKFQSPHLSNVFLICVQFFVFGKYKPEFDKSEFGNKNHCLVRQSTDETKNRIKIHKQSFAMNRTGMRGIHTIMKSMGVVGQLIVILFLVGVYFHTKS